MLIIYSSPFHVWRTYNKIQSQRERIKDNKNNYPICIPRPSEGENRTDAICESGYYYGMRDMNTSDENKVIALVEVEHDGIKKITHFKNGFKWMEELFPAS